MSIHEVNSNEGQHQLGNGVGRSETGGGSNPVRPDDCYEVGVGRNNSTDWAWLRDEGDCIGHGEACELARE